MNNGDIGEKQLAKEKVIIMAKKMQHEKCFISSNVTLVECSLFRTYKTRVRMNSNQQQAIITIKDQSIITKRRLLSTE